MHFISKLSPWFLSRIYCISSSIKNKLLEDMQIYQWSILGKYYLKCHLRVWCGFSQAANIAWISNACLLQVQAVNSPSACHCMAENVFLNWRTTTSLILLWWTILSFRRQLSGVKRTGESVEMDIWHWQLIGKCLLISFLVRIVSES